MMRLNLKSSKGQQPLCLAKAPNGCWLRITGICNSCPECERLKEMGFSESTLVRKIASSTAILCQIGGARLAVCQELGQHIHVEQA